MINVIYGKNIPLKSAVYSTKFGDVEIKYTDDAIAEVNIITDSKKADSSIQSPLSDKNVYTAY